MQTQQQLAGTFTAADASPDVRAAFIRRTYQHLAMAILAFVALEFVFFNTPIAAALFSVMVGVKYSWLLVLALLDFLPYGAWRRALRRQFFIEVDSGLILLVSPAGHTHVLNDTCPIQEMHLSRGDNDGPERFMEPKASH